MSRRPPSQRDPEFSVRRVERALVQRVPGTGRVAGASPTTAGPGVSGRAEIRGAGTGSTSAVQFARDRFELDAPTPTLSLSFLPVPESPHVYLNGIEQDEDIDYTLDGRTLTVLAPMEALADDVIDVRYAYLTGLPWLPSDPPLDGFFDDFNRVSGDFGNGWTTIGGGIVAGKAKGSFARDLAALTDLDLSNGYELEFTVPAGINKFLEVNIGMASSDEAPPAEFHVFTIGMAFSGGTQIHYRNPDGTLTAYHHVTQPVAVAPGDVIRLTVSDTWIYAYVNDVLVEDAPPATAYAGTWLMIDANPTADPGSTTTIDDLWIREVAP